MITKLMDASEGMQILAASGMEVNDILATSEDMFTLMSAGSVDADTAASVLTNTMAQFNLTTEDSGRIIDGFAEGAASAKLGVDDLEYIMGQAGGTMASMNMDMEQSIAMAGQLANAGMPIGQVGTALNAMGREIKANADEFSKLGIEVYDNNGVMKDMGSVLGELEEKLKGKTDAERDAMLSTVFSGQAMKGALDWLSLGTEGYEELTESMYGAEGAANKLAETNEDNLGGAFRSLKSSLGTLLIGIGDSLTPILQTVAGVVENLVNKFNSMDESKRDLIVRLGLLAAAIGPILVMGSKLLRGLGKVAGFMSIPKLLIGGLIAGFIYLMATSQEFRNTMSQLLNGLVDMVQKIVGLLGKLWDRYGEKIKSVFSFVGETILSAMQNIMGVIRDVVGFINAILEGDWASAWEFAANAVLGIKDTIAGILKAIGTIIKGAVKLLLGLLKGLIGKIGEVVKGIFTRIGEKILEGIETVKEKISAFKDGVLEAGKGVIEGIKNGVQNGIGKVKEAFINGFKMIPEDVIYLIFDLVELFHDSFLRMVDIVKNVWNIIKTVFLGAILIITDLVTLNFDQLGEDIRLIWDNLKLYFGELWENLKELFFNSITAISLVITEAWNSLKEYIVGLWEDLKLYLTSVWINIKISAVEGWNSLKESVSNIISNTITWIKEKWNGIIDWFRELPGKLREIGSNMFNSLKEGLASKISSVVEKAKEVGEKVKEAIKELPKQMLNIGKDIMSGLADGIKNGIMAPINAAKNAASRVGGAIRDKLKIASPSKLMIEYGQFTTEGLAVGMENKLGTLDRASTQAVETINDPVVTRAGQPVVGAREELVFKPNITINVNGNADDTTVRDIGDIVERELEKAFIKLRVKGV